MSASRKRDLFTLAIGLAVVLADQLTKAWIVQYFVYAEGRPPIQIVGDFLTLLYVKNTGVAFSLFEGQNIKFALIFVALAVVGYLYWRFRSSPSLWLRLGFALVLGGALGNLLDRFTRGYVVDFIYFQIPNTFYFPLFNVADSAITVGVALIALILYRISAAEADHPASTNQRSPEAQPKPNGEPTNSRTVNTAHPSVRAVRSVRSGDRS